MVITEITQGMLPSTVIFKITLHYYCQGPDADLLNANSLFNLLVDLLLPCEARPYRIENRKVTMPSLSWHRSESILASINSFVSFETGEEKSPLPVDN